MRLPRYTCRGIDLLDQSNDGSSVTQSREEAADVVRVGASRVDSTPGVAAGSPLSLPVLLIVPDPEVRGFLRFGLEREGFELFEANSGSEGLEIAGSNRLGAVLLDMDAANPEGLEIIQRLRASNLIPILALAGRTGRVGAVETLDYGAHDFISRPVQLGELAARLRAALRSTPAPASEVF